MANSHVLRADFQYRHRNPYHDRLQDYGHFVLTDHQGEQFQGRWREAVFHNSRPLVVEVGSGFGYFMREYCQQNPRANFIGMDYRFKRSFKLVKQLSHSGLDNFRYLRARGERLHFIFGPGEVDEIFLFFPDPWQKNRQHKKRLVQTPFLDSAHKVLTTQGTLSIKTDHAGYAQWMLEHFIQDDRWALELASCDLHRACPNHFLSIYTTKFEKIFLAQKIPTRAFVLRKL